MTVIDNAFDIGQVVYLRTDPDQSARLVTGLLVQRSQTLYYLSYGETETRHFDFEISAERDVLASSGLGTNDE